MQAMALEAATMAAIGVTSGTVPRAVRTDTGTAAMEAGMAVRAMQAAKIGVASHCHPIRPIRAGDHTAAVMMDIQATIATAATVTIPHRVRPATSGGPLRQIRLIATRMPADTPKGHRMEVLLPRAQITVRVIRH